jgi:hypothetical protein
MNQRAVSEELEQVLDNIPEYHTKILLGGFNAKLGRDNTSKPTIREGNLHQNSYDNGVTVVNFVTSKI